MFRPPGRTLPPDAATGRGLQSALSSPGSRFDGGAVVHSRSVAPVMTCWAVGSNDAKHALENVTPNPLVPSVGHDIDAEPDLEAPPGKPGDHPDCRADAQGDLAGQQQTIRAGIQQSHRHRNVQGHNRPVSGRDAR